MPVVGLHFNTFSGKRSDKPVPGGELKVNSTPKINEVKEVSLQGLDKKALSLEFEFVTDYAPEIGEIKVEGVLLFVTKDNEEAVKQWKKDKSLPEEISVPVLNHLFRRCLLKIANMAEDLNLPAPLQFPMVKAKE